MLRVADSAEARLVSMKLELEPVAQKLRSWFSDDVNLGGESVMLDPGQRD
jgi:hypothetical protein